MSTVMVYREPAPTVPQEHPCRTCRAHGPYCMDFCVVLDAWLQAEAGKDRQDRPNEPAEAGR